MNSYKIAPTDLTFLLNGCARCFHHKVVNGWRPPYRPMPSVFNKIDKAMKMAFEGGSSFLTKPGIIATKSISIKSTPIPISDDIAVWFNGRPDAIAYYEDGTVGIIDFKTSSVKDEYTELYWRQLNAGRVGLEHPAKGELRTVHDMFLLSAVPVSMDFKSDGNPVFSMELARIDLDLDIPRWDEFLKHVAGLLRAEPEGKENCPDCALRQSGWSKDGFVHL